MKDTFALEPFSPKLNIELFDRIKKAIIQYPERFDMIAWFEAIDVHDWEELKMSELAKTHTAPCGTVACIAGWAVLLDDEAMRIMVENEKRLGYTTGNFCPSLFAGWTEENACQALGISDDADEVEYDEDDPYFGEPMSEAQRLFIVCNWPAEFRVPYVDANSPDVKAMTACARIDHFIMTGE